MRTQKEIDRDTFNNWKYKMEFCSFEPSRSHDIYVRLLCVYVSFCRLCAPSCMYVRKSDWKLSGLVFLIRIFVIGCCQQSDARVKYVKAIILIAIPPSASPSISIIIITLDHSNFRMLPYLLHANASFALFIHEARVKWWTRKFYTAFCQTNNAFQQQYRGIHSLEEKQLTIS